MDLPGEGVRRVPLPPRGQRYATTSKAVARQLARSIRRQAQATGTGAQPDDPRGLRERWRYASEAGSTPRHVRAKVRDVRLLLDEADVHEPAQVTVQVVQDHVAALR